MVGHEIEIRSMAREDVPELLRLMQGIVAYERGTDWHKKRPPIG